MPTPSSSSTKPGKPKPAAAKGAGLKRKVGPLPLWAWVAIVAGAAGAYWLFVRGRAGAGEPAVGGPEVVTGSGGYTPQMAAGAGAPAENAALAGQLDPATLQALQDQLGAQVGDIRGHVTELEDAFSASGFTRNEDKTWTAPGADGDVGGIEDLVRSIVESMGGVQAPPPAPGVRWGGQTFTTKAGIASYLRGRGQSYSKWAANHPAAARSLGGPVPKPKTKPARPGPKRPPARKPPAQRPAARKPPAKPPARKVPARRTPAKPPARRR